MMMMMMMMMMTYYIFKIWTLVGTIHPIENLL